MDMAPEEAMVIVIIRRINLIADITNITNVGNIANMTMVREVEVMVSIDGIMTMID